MSHRQKPDNRAAAWPSDVGEQMSVPDGDSSATRSEGPGLTNLPIPVAVLSLFL